MLAFAIARDHQRGGGGRYASTDQGDEAVRWGLHPGDGGDLVEAAAQMIVEARHRQFLHLKSKFSYCSSRSQVAAGSAGKNEWPNLHQLPS